MTEQPDPDMEALAASDLDRAQESLYYSARRYCAITEQLFLQQASDLSPDDPSFISIGDASAELVEAGQRYAEAYNRYEPFLPDEEDDESEED